MCFASRTRWKNAFPPDQSLVRARRLTPPKTEPRREWRGFLLVDTRCLTAFDRTPGEPKLALSRISESTQQFARLPGGDPPPSCEFRPVALSRLEAPRRRSHRPRWSESPGRGVAGGFPPGSPGHQPGSSLSWRHCRQSEGLQSWCLSGLRSAISQACRRWYHRSLPRCGPTSAGPSHVESVPTVRGMRMRRRHQTQQYCWRPARQSVHHSV